MCGIIAGNVKKLKDTGGIKDHLRMIDHRGTDSFGMIMYDPKTKSWDTFKTLGIKPFVKAFNNLSNGAYVIVHNRARSIGGITLALAHPIVTNNVAVIHNGTNKDVHKMIKGSASDTESISMLQGNAIDFGTTFSWLGDLGVVFTVDLERPENDVYLHRDKIRPLVINKDTDIIASEPLFDGAWADIKEQDSYVPLHLNKLTRLVRSIDYVDVTVADDSMCLGCKKKHLHSKTGRICNVCLVRGEKEPKVTHTKAVTTTVPYVNRKEEAKLELQTHRIGRFVEIADGSLMHSTVFDSYSMYKRKELVGYKEVEENTKEWITEPIDKKHMTVTTGNKMYLFATENNTNLDYEEVFGYVVKSELGTWYVVEDPKHDVEASAWYKVYYTIISTTVTIPIEPVAYSEDNFAEYLCTCSNNTIMVDTTETYTIDKQTSAYMGIHEDFKDLIRRSNGDILVPMAYEW